MKTVLFLDIATRTGWAFDDADGTRPRVGTFKAPPHGVGEYGPPCSRFQRWLTDICTTFRPDIVAFEAPLARPATRDGKIVTNANTARLLLGFATIAEVVAHDLSISCREVNVGTVKKAFAGSGRAEKKDILERCAELGWSVKDHNEADAAAGWACAKMTFYPGWGAAATPMFTTGNRDRLFDRSEDQETRR